MRGMDHWKENRSQEVWKGKINQVRNRLNCFPGHPTQDEISLLVEMGGQIGPFIFYMAYGLSSPRLGCGKSLDQVRSADMDEAPEVRELSFCKTNGGQQDNKICCQGLHHGRSDPRTDILILYA